MRRSLLYGLLVLGFSGMLWGQSPSGLGIAPFGSYFSSDIDSINLYSGNVLADIPLFSLSGREGGTQLRLSYNAQGWEDGSTPFGPYGFYSGGWRIANPGLEGVLVQPYLIDCPDPGPPPNQPTGGWGLYVAWKDGSGALHTYQSPTFSVAPADGGCDSFSWANQAGQWLMSNQQDTDGSLAFVGPSGSRIHLPDGRTLDANGTRLVSRNGNYAETVWNGGILEDMLGRTIGYSWNVGASGYHYGEYTVQDSTGTSRAYRLYYEDCHTVHNPIENTTECLAVLSSIGLPNGRSYQFEYAHTQGFLTKITLPSGGYIEFDYEGGNSDTDASHNYVVERRVSADGTSEVAWTYARSTSGGYRTVTVTDPEDHQVVHTFDGAGYETETQWKETSIAAPSKIVQTTRSAGLPFTVVTTMGTLEQRQTFDWSYARMTESTQSDWYTIGGTVVPLTKTIYSYPSCSVLPCNLNFRSQVELQQWTGSGY